MEPATFFEITSDPGSRSVPEVDCADLEAVLSLCGGPTPAPDSREKATGMSIFQEACSP
jgi:hypothetical protein